MMETSCSSNVKYSTTENHTNWSAEEAIAGNKAAVEALRELITYPLLYAAQASQLGLKFPRSLLLYGPPGTGKTSLVRAVVQECGAHLIVIGSHTVHRAHAGESEKVLREAFSEASSQAMSGIPAVIFIDEIDALCPRRRDSRREQEVRITSQLLLLMDANNRSSATSPHVVVVASTNRIDFIDPALRRYGRFDNEIAVTTPTEEERFQILKLYTKYLSLDPTVDLREVAASCNGFVGADLEALCHEAYESATRSSDANNDDAVPCLKMNDWNTARKVVSPSITKGVTVEIPNVSWDDIGGLKDLKKKLKRAVELPIKCAGAFKHFKLPPVHGVLLHGPPGCSKTTLAKAAANAAQASFFSLSCADLFSMYVGEGEALLRNVFQRARLAAPSIIFFDEADVIAAKRDGTSSNSNVVGERLVSTLLTEMDGLEEVQGILVLAATNRPHAIDAAIRRPGRFDLVLHVPPPDLEGRFEILRVHTRNMSMKDDVDLQWVAERTELFTGAELEALCREAGILAVREKIDTVCHRHFQIVTNSLKPALTWEDVERYASCLGTSSVKSSSHTNFSKKQIKHKARFWIPNFAKFGFLGISLVFVAKFLIASTNPLISHRQYYD